MMGIASRGYNAGSQVYERRLEGTELTAELRAPSPYNADYCVSQLAEADRFNDIFVRS